MNYPSERWKNLKPYKLSICIATYNRGKFIGETLDSIIAEMRHGVEIVVVDGASPDETPQVLNRYLRDGHEIQYFREEVNSGVDRDYDKAVSYARGEYCWLMSDDDLIQSGSISRILNAIECKPDLVVVNSEVRNLDFSVLLNTRILKFTSDRDYQENEAESFFVDTASYLSFIGAVVINRNLWLGRDRESYYGTLFVHIGVIFQKPALKKVKVIADPLITIRYGNAMWTPRSFEIWMFKWPSLIWSFKSFSHSAKQSVIPISPWKSTRTLFYNRALGAYTFVEYEKFIALNTTGRIKALAFAIAIFPRKVAYAIAVIYFLICKRNDLMAQSDLLRSCKKSSITRMLARLF